MAPNVLNGLSDNVDVTAKRAKKSLLALGTRENVNKAKIGAEVEKSTNFHRFASEIAFKLEFF